MELYFSIITLDILLSTSEDIVEPSNEISVYEYNNYFMIVGGNCNVKDKINANLINKNFATESQLEDMTVD